MWCLSGPHKIFANASNGASVARGTSVLMHPGRGGDESQPHVLAHEVFHVAPFLLCSWKPHRKSKCPYSWKPQGSKESDRSNSCSSSSSSSLCCYYYDYHYCHYYLEPRLPNSRLTDSVRPRTGGLYSWGGALMAGPATNSCHH